MAIRYYDDAISEKMKKWIPDGSNLRVLKPDESKRLFELKADDSGDAPIKLPFIALSRDKDFELLSNVKNNKSFDGIRIERDIDQSMLMNVIPIKVEYQLDIYTKTYEEGDEYVRNFLFKLINNPALSIDIPYNDSWLHHRAYLRVLSTVSDTSDIQEHLFAGQFTRWSIKLELQDAFLFSIPYKNNWKFIDADIEVSNRIDLDGDVEHVWNYEDDGLAK